MAHDRQYKCDEDGQVMGRLACPRKGEWYWNRHKGVMEQADRDLDEWFLIPDRGD